MTKIRWGLIGAGWIANKAIAPAMHAASGAIVQAVASRDPERSLALNPVTIHESYGDLISDSAVDAVYISLPNHLHCQWSVAALQAGKHVLCEKPFAMNAPEVNLMASAARENNRLFDVGVYLLHAMAALVGDNAQMEIQSCDVTKGPTGIDLTSKWQLRFAGSITARGLASFELPESQSLIVHGEKESVELVGKEVFTSWHAPSQLRLGENVEEFEAVDPYQLMIENFGRRVQGQESWVRPLETSVFVQKTMDQLRAAF